MNSFIIKNAQIVTPGGIIPNGSLRVEEGIISHIDHTSRIDHPMAGPGSAVDVIDAEGAILMPGIIDIHTDALDYEIVPRPGADIPIVIAFRELERKMAGCGFTTVFHSLHLGYEVAEGQLRSRYSRREVFETVHRACSGPALLNNKIHLRFEVTGVNAYDICLEFIRNGMISMLSVMDHTPGQGQWGREQFIATMLKRGKTEQQAVEEFREMMARPRIEGARLEEMIRLAKAHRIPVASHDDDTVEKVNFMHNLGVDICEFPINLETAVHATQLGMHVAGGASNILRGGSLSGNLSMKEAVGQSAVDTLCSDYYPPSILHSVFKLHLEEEIPLTDAVNMATLHPARAAQIQDHTGSIECGKNADLLLVQMVEGLPMVTHSMVNGNIVFRSAMQSQGTQGAFRPADHLPNKAL